MLLLKVPKHVDFQKKVCFSNRQGNYLSLTLDSRRANSTEAYTI